MTDDQIKHMVERFLTWKLPANFNPDNGISAVRPNYGPSVAWEPVGTNLLDYTQAEAMVRHIVEGIPDRPSPPPADDLVEKVAEILAGCVTNPEALAREIVAALASSPRVDPEAGERSK